MKLNNVCIIGLGYVGLTLAVVLAESGFKVFGIEKNKEVLDQLKKGNPHFHEKNLARLLNKHNGKNLFLFGEIPANEQIDCFIIAVSTPVDKATKKPKMEFVINGIEEVSSHLKPKQLIILRSTVPIGTSRNVVLPMLKKEMQ